MKSGGIAADRSGIHSRRLIPKFSGALAKVPTFKVSPLNRREFYMCTRSNISNTVGAMPYDTMLTSNAVLQMLASRRGIPASLLSTDRFQLS